MTVRRVGAGALAVALATGLSACGLSVSSPAARKLSSTLTGAGSALAGPIYAQWRTTLRPQGVDLRYRTVSSGRALSELDRTKVGYASTDLPLSRAEARVGHGTILQFPMAGRAVVLVYNLPGVMTGLRLSGPVIAGIFSGSITRWSASAITSLNPGVTLPDTRIHVVHRADPADATTTFTTYLAGVVPAWRTAVGVGGEVRWPVGAGAVGNRGVATAVRRTPGTIGYVEETYQRENHTTLASVPALGGLFVPPTVGSTSSAFNEIGVLSNLPTAALDAPGAGAYPIVSEAFLDAYQDPCQFGGLTSREAKGLYEFLSFALGAGQTTFGSGAGNLPFAPVPGSVRAADNKQLKTMRCNGALLS